MKKGFSLKRLTVDAVLAALDRALEADGHEHRTQTRQRAIQRLLSGELYRIFSELRRCGCDSPTFSPVFFDRIYKSAFANSNSSEKSAL